VRLLHTRCTQVLEDHLLERLRRFSLSVTADLRALDEITMLVQVEHPVGRDALNCEWAGDADLAIVYIRLVVQILEFGLGRNRCVDFLLPCDACWTSAT